MNDITLKQLQEIQMILAKEKGWGTTPEEVNIGEKFALLFTEVAEAYESYRQNNWDGDNSVSEGLGDVIQRAVHLCGILGINADEAVMKKLQTNKTREWDWTKINETRQ